jgi:hypothetical protein
MFFSGAMAENIKEETRKSYSNKGYRSKEGLKKKLKNKIQKGKEGRKGGREGERE